MWSWHTWLAFTQLCSQFAVACCPLPRYCKRNHSAYDHATSAEHALGRQQCKRNWLKIADNTSSAVECIHIGCPALMLRGAIGGPYREALGSSQCNIVVFTLFENYVKCKASAASFSKLSLRKSQVENTMQNNQP